MRRGRRIQRRLRGAVQLIFRPFYLCELSCRRNQDVVTDIPSASKERLQLLLREAMTLRHKDIDGFGEIEKKLRISIRSDFGASSIELEQMKQFQLPYDATLENLSDDAWSTAKSEMVAFIATMIKFGTTIPKS